MATEDEALRELGIDPAQAPAPAEGTRCAMRYLCLRAPSEANDQQIRDRTCPSCFACACARLLLVRVCAPPSPARAHRDPQWRLHVHTGSGGDGTQQAQKTLSSHPWYARMPAHMHRLPAVACGRDMPDMLGSNADSTSLPTPGDQPAGGVMVAGMPPPSEAPPAAEGQAAAAAEAAAKINALLQARGFGGAGMPAGGGMAVGGIAHPGIAAPGAIPVTHVGLCLCPVLPCLFVSFLPLRSGNSVPLVRIKSNVSLYIYLFLPCPSQMSAAALQLRSFPLASAAHRARHSLDCTRVSAACIVFLTSVHVSVVVPSPSL